MKKEKLEKRIVDALVEMYDKAENVFGVKLSWEEVKNLCPIRDGMPTLPWMAFYLPLGDYLEILDKYSKHTHTVWTWPYKIYMTYDDEQIESMRKKLEEMKSEEDCAVLCKHIQEDIEQNEERKKRNEQFDKYIDEHRSLMDLYKEKKIDKKECDKRYKELIKKYSLKQRNYEKEGISFNVGNYAPCTSDKYYSEIAAIYGAMQMSELDFNEKNIKHVMGEFGLDNDNLVCDIMLVKEFEDNIDKKK